jgi:single-strand DNA-binding protein
LISFLPQPQEEPSGGRLKKKKILKNYLTTKNKTVMEITGRLTADAIISTTKSDKEVVNFSIAVNDRYKTKSGEVNTITEYFRCAYWISTKVAGILTKGTIVALSGRASADAWVGSDGKAKAAMNFHTSGIKILGGGSRQAVAETTLPKKTDKAGTDTPDDDLPF